MTSLNIQKSQTYNYHAKIRNIVNFKTKLIYKN